MKKLVSESLNEYMDNFERMEDPKDAIGIGDILGRKIDRLKQGEPAGESDSIEAIEILRRSLDPDEWYVQSVGSEKDPLEIMVGKTEDRYRGPHWAIRSLGKKGQFVTYEYKTAHRKTGKPYFRNKEIPLTWQELAIKCLELIHDKELRLPKHTDW